MKRRSSHGGLIALVVLGVAAVGVLALVVSLVDYKRENDPPPIPPKVNVNDRTPLVRITDPSAPHESKEIVRFHVDIAREYHKLRAGKEGYALPDHGVLLSLMELASWELILRRHNWGITPQELADERARQERETKDRGTFRKIEDLLNPYPGMFEMMMVRPALANNRIYKLHQDRSVQVEAYKKGEAGHAEALKDPDGYFRRQKEQNPDFYQRVDTRDPMAGKMPKDQQAHLPPDHFKIVQERAREFCSKWLGATPVGSVTPQLADEEGSYLVLRLLERVGDDWIYEVVAYRKILYDVWYEAELRKLKGEVVDPATRDLLKDKLKDHRFGRWLFGS